jgi:hypothetical protein
MLFRLRMSARDARDAYARFMTFVLSERKRASSSIFKASRLEQAIAALISEQLAGNEKAKMVDETGPKWCVI